MVEGQNLRLALRTPQGDTVDAVRKKSHCVRKLAVAGQNEEMVENMPLYIYAFHGKYRLYGDNRQVGNAGHWGANFPIGH
jgi:hypothetical protein